MKAARGQQRRAPPRDEAELLDRARGIAGTQLAELARRLGVTITGDAVRTKGKVGQLVEQALGATGGSQATWDFPALQIELKTIPLDSRGAPRESTFVCTFPLSDADRAEWVTSWVRAKLGRVLWIPVLVDAPSPSIGRPLLWSPTREQEAVLTDDFEEIVGRIGAGDIEGITARTGRWLQLRPKAAHGRVRTLGRGSEGEIVPTVPRGFYLRSLFTGAILGEPTALPGLRSTGE